MRKVVFGLANNESHAQRIVDRLLSAGFDNETISILMAQSRGGRTSLERGSYESMDFEEQPRNARRNASEFENEPRNARNPRNTEDLDTEQRTTQHRNPSKEMRRSTMSMQNTTKAPEGAATGAISGGIIGGSLGLLAGIGALAIPGIGPFIAAGPLMAALAGSAVGGSLGLVVGALVGLGIPEYEAKRYEQGLKSGQVLIVIHVGSGEEADRAMEIMKNEGAKDISSSMEKARSRR